MHELRYGTSRSAEPAQIVSLRSTVTGASCAKRRGPRSKRDAARHRRGIQRQATVYVREKRASHAPTNLRARLLAGNSIKGPALGGARLNDRSSCRERSARAMFYGQSGIRSVGTMEICGRLANGRETIACGSMERDGRKFMVAVVVMGLPLEGRSYPDISPPA